MAWEPNFLLYHLWDYIEIFILDRFKGIFLLFWGVFIIFSVSSIAPIQHTPYNKNKLWNWHFVLIQWFFNNTSGLQIPAVVQEEDVSIVVPTTSTATTTTSTSATTSKTVYRPQSTVNRRKRQIQRQRSLIAFSAIDELEAEWYREDIKRIRLKSELLAMQIQEKKDALNVREYNVIVTDDNKL